MVDDTSRDDDVFDDGDTSYAPDKQSSEISDIALSNSISVPIMLGIDNIFTAEGWTPDRQPK